MLCRYLCSLLWLAQWLMGGYCSTSRYVCPRPWRQVFLLQLIIYELQHISISMVLQFVTGMALQINFSVGTWKSRLRASQWDKFLTHWMQTFNTLLVDINHRAPSAANASTSLVRYALAAVVVAFLGDMFHSMGIGWAFTVVAGFIVLAVALLTLEYCQGLAWRQAATVKFCGS